MNLVDLWKRKDRALRDAPADVEAVAHRVGDQSMHSLRIPAGRTLRIAELPAFPEMRVPPRWPGWAASIASGKGTAVLRIAVDIGPGLRTEEVATLRLDAANANLWAPIRCNWPLLGDVADAHLLIETKGDADAAIALGIGDVVDLRAAIFARAKGQGIEIGPGMNPQIRPAPGVEVRYLEKHSVEEWARIYPKQELDAVPPQVRALWKDYVTGNAQRLETIDDASLDFVFSSHVFEHLVNPLGTLAAWRTKLRAGGRVLGVTPDAANCFDLRQPLSRPDDWLAEFAAGSFEVEDRHYERWVRFTEPRTTPQSLKQRDYSVHVHFYTPVTFGQLLTLAVQRIGFRGFDVRSTPNNKDFAWALHL